jgi:hypothetical protein
MEKEVHYNCLDFGQFPHLRFRHSQRQATSFLSRLSFERTRFSASTGNLLSHHATADDGSSGARPQDIADAEVGSPCPFPTEVDHRLSSQPTLP